MIDTREHVYSDDPASGHPDVRTTLEGVSYFFLGNGLIQAAIQFAPGGEGTPLGLIIMNPEKLAAKRHALTCDPEQGLRPTQFEIRDTGCGTEHRPDNLTVRWSEKSIVPSVVARWTGKGISVSERFYCPNRSEADLVREVNIRNGTGFRTDLDVSTAVPSGRISRRLSISAGESVSLTLLYTLSKKGDKVELSEIDHPPELHEAQCYWRISSRLSFSNPLLNHYFRSSCAQLPAVISQSGVVDASIWQYNREWVRDHSFMALGLTLSGHHELAGTVLQRLLNDFISDEGASMDSSEIRDYDEVELDQGGVLLYALLKYVHWTGDRDIIRRNWRRIEKTAEFPLKTIFRHEASGMLFNRRDFWERHAAHGIMPGLELMYQAFPVIGLRAAISLARIAGKGDKTEYWELESSKLKRAVLDHPEYALLDDRGFIKRRALDCSIEETITPGQDSGLPREVPLAKDMVHYLNPDSASAMLIAYGFIPPDSELAGKTLNNLESLWNQAWKGGGYGRYNITSEPDSAGPWPFASLYIARAYAEMGDYGKVRRVLDWLSRLTGAASGSWFEMYGQRIAPPYPQVGVTPWTWSEMIMLLVENLLGIKPNGKTISFRPCVFPGLERVKGSLPFREHRIDLDINLDPTSALRSVQINGSTVKSSSGEFCMEYHDEDITIENSVAD